MAMYALNEVKGMRLKMKEKIDYDNLYVACPVFESELVEEPYVQYETFGKVRHTIFISPKRVLLYSKTDADGNIKYYRYKTGEEVSETSYNSSFYTQSSPMKNLYSGYIHGFTNLPITELRQLCDKMYENKTKAVGYFIPFSEFMEDKFGTSFDSCSPRVASKLVTLANLTTNGKKIILSQDKEIAEEQLQDIGYHSDSKKTIVYTSKK